MTTALRPHMLLPLLSWLVAAVLLTVNPVQAQDLSCPAEVSLNGPVVEVAASSSGDDTESIQCALDLAVNDGYREVFLTSPEYTVSSVYADNFTGDLRGKSFDATLVRVADASIDCATGQNNAVFGFSNGDVVVRRMAIEVGSPCGDGSPVSVVGFFTDPQDCSKRTTFGRLDRVTVSGAGLAGDDVVTGVMMDTSAGCDFEAEKLLGVFGVNRSDFTGLEFGIITSVGASEQVDITFNEFITVGVPISIVDANQTSTIQNNRIYYNDVTGYQGGVGTVGILIASTSIAEPINASVIKGNKFFDGGLSASGIGILLGQEGKNIDHSLVIISNQFNGSSAADQGTGVAAIDTSGGLVANNAFSGDMGVWLDIQSGNPPEFPGSTVVGWSITGNDFGAGTTLDPVDIRFGENTSGNIVGSSQGGPLVEDLSGGLNDDLTGSGTSAWMGGALRSLPGDSLQEMPVADLLSAVNSMRYYHTADLK